MQTREERLDSSTLFFERGAGGEVEVNGEGSEHWGMGSENADRMIFKLFLIVFLSVMALRCQVPLDFRQVPL